MFPCAKKVADLGLNFEDMTREEFRNYLDVSILPPVDMIVRTGWHKRLSWFLLYDSEYAESCFLDINWPDFDKQHLKAVVDQFNISQRKFWK